MLNEACYVSKYVFHYTSIHWLEVYNSRPSTEKRNTLEVYCNVFTVFQIDKTLKEMALSRAASNHAQRVLEIAVHPSHTLPAVSPQPSLVVIHYPNYTD